MHNSEAGWRKRSEDPPDATLSSAHVARSKVVDSDGSAHRPLHTPVVPGKAGYILLCPRNTLLAICSSGFRRGLHKKFSEVVPGGCGGSSARGQAFYAPWELAPTGSETSVACVGSRGMQQSRTQSYRFSVESTLGSFCCRLGGRCGLTTIDGQIQRHRKTTAESLTRFLTRLKTHGPDQSAERQSSVLRQRCCLLVPTLCGVVTETSGADCALPMGRSFCHLPSTNYRETRRAGLSYNGSLADMALSPSQPSP